jgi:hypothetical protein
VPGRVANITRAWALTPTRPRRKSTWLNIGTDNGGGGGGSIGLM